MFTIKATHNETIVFESAASVVREFFADIKNFIDLMPNIESIRADNQGITHWAISTKIPFVGSFHENFPIVKTEDSDDRVEWSPFEEEEYNLMRFAADFLPKDTSQTVVKMSHHIELRRRSATDLHMLAGFAGESLISNEMSRSVAEMMGIFSKRAKKRVEG